MTEVLRHDDDEGDEEPSERFRLESAELCFETPMRQLRDDVFLEGGIPALTDTEVAVLLIRLRELDRCQEMLAEAHAAGTLGSAWRELISAPSIRSKADRRVVARCERTTMQNERSQEIRSPEKPLVLEREQGEILGPLSCGTGCELPCSEPNRR